MEFLDQSTSQQGDYAAKASDNVVVEAKKVPSPVLQRLMEEVKNDKANDIFAYDRAHNRHNRSWRSTLWLATLSQLLNWTLFL